MSEYYSATQLEALRDQLEALDESLAEVLQSTESGEAPVKLKDNVGRLSRMDEPHNQGILKANRVVLSNRLKKVRQARMRFDESEFGVCEWCERAIGFERLMVYPDATLCIACQSEQERE